MSVTAEGDARKERTSSPSISGTTAAVLVLFVAAIAFLANWAASDAAAHRVIGDDAGVIVAIALAAVFLLASFGPSLRETVPGFGAAVRFLSALCRPLGHFLSAVDRGLAQGVARLAGATFRSVGLRYAVLLVHLVGAAALSWWLQANAQQPWPFAPQFIVAQWAGFMPLIWGFIVAFAISRRWAWIEQDRETAMITNEYEWSAGGALRIGFDQDLRDEALLSFVFIFLFVPLGLSQLAAYGFFQYPQGFEPHYIEWLGFFGAELAKAVPFVDWAEVYDVGRGTRIQVVPGPGQHLVFAVRVMIDLILLAALLQALQVSSRVDTQKREFEHGRLKRLDPFLERDEFRRLAAGEAYATTPLNFSYEPGRLFEIAVKDPSPEVRAVAIRLIWQQRCMGRFDLFSSRLVSEQNEHVLKLLAALAALEPSVEPAKRNIPEAVNSLTRAIEARYNTSGSRQFSEVLVANLGAFSPPDARDALLRIIREASHQDVRKAAIKQIMKDTADDPLDEIVRALAERLTLPDAAKEVRKVTVTALKVRRSRVAVNALGRVLGWHSAAPDTDQNVRRRAVEALAEIGGAGAREALAHAAKNDASEAVRAASRAALQAMA